MAGHPKIGHDTPRNMARINTAMGSKTTRPPKHPSSTLSDNYDIGSIANMTGARGTHSWRSRVWPRDQPSPRHVTPLDEKIFVDPPEGNSGLLTFRALARAHCGCNVSRCFQCTSRRDCYGEHSPFSMPHTSVNQCGNSPQRYMSWCVNSVDRLAHAVHHTRFMCSTEPKRPNKSAPTPPNYASRRARIT